MDVIGNLGREFFTPLRTFLFPPSPEPPAPQPPLPRAFSVPALGAEYQDSDDSDLSLCDLGVQSFRPWHSQTDLYLYEADYSRNSSPFHDEVQEFKVQAEIKEKQKLQAEEEIKQIKEKPPESPKKPAESPRKGIGGKDGKGIKHYVRLIQQLQDKSRLSQEVADMRDRLEYEHEPGTPEMPKRKVPPGPVLLRQGTGPFVLKVSIGQRGDLDLPWYYRISLGPFENWFINGLVLDCVNSITLPMQLPQSWAKPLIKILFVTLCMVKAFKKTCIIL